MKMLKLILLVTLFCYTLSTPVNCSGGTSALEFEIETYNTDPCEGLICQHTCASCQKVLTLKLDSILTTPKQISQFQTLCNAQKNHERISENFLFQTTKSALISCGQTGLQNVQNFVSMAQLVSLNPHTSAGVSYLLALATEYRNLGKTCDKKPSWKRTILDTINNINEEKLSQFQNNFPSGGMLLQRIIFGGNNLKKKFRDALQSDFDYCSCGPLLKQGGNTYQSLINSLCQNLCSGTTTLDELNDLDE
jgi:hypothetical protein